MRLHRQRAAASIGLVVVGALALRLVLFVGYASVDPWDDGIYLSLAEEVRVGNIDATIARVDATLDEGRLPEPASSFVTRRGTVYPIALMQTLFGANEVASVVPSLLASLGMVLTTYWIGYRLGGERVAAVSAVLISVVPLDVVYATRILADTPSAFWFTAALACVLEGRHRDTTSQNHLFYLLAGAALFIGYTARITTLLALPLAALAAGTREASGGRARYTRLGLLFAPLLAGLLAEGIHYRATTGRFFFIAELERASSLWMFTSLPEALFHPSSRFVVHLSYEEGTLHHFFKLFWGSVEHYGGLNLVGLFAPMGVLAALMVLMKPRRETSFLVIWLVTTFLFFQYGPRALQWRDDALHYFLVAPRLRYLLPLLPPLVILIALALETIRMRAPRISTTLLLGAILYGGFESYRCHRFYRGSLEDMRAASRFLADASGPLITDGWAQQQLRFLSRGHAGGLQTIGSAPPGSGSLVLIGGARGFDLASEDVSAWLPSPFAELHLADAPPPEGWEEVFRRRGEHHLTRQTDLRVYRVP